MSDQKKSKEQRDQHGRNLDKKKKKALLKTFLRKEIRSPFVAPIGLIAHVPFKTCKKLGLNAESFK
jgi:hypothetical protein